jgi:hypothetical protein
MKKALTAERAQVTLMRIATMNLNQPTNKRKEKRRSIRKILTQRRKRLP